MDTMQGDAGTKGIICRGVGCGRTTALLSFVFPQLDSPAPPWQHLCRCYGRKGGRSVAAVAVGALVGSAQVVGRLPEFRLLHQMHPLLSSRLAAPMHPTGVGRGLLTIAGAPMAPVFSVFRGAGNS